MDKYINTNASPPAAAIREEAVVAATPALALPQEDGGQTISDKCSAQRTAIGAATASAPGPAHPPDAVLKTLPTAGESAPVAGSVALSTPVEDAGEQQKQGLPTTTRASGRNKRSAASSFIPPSVAQQRRDILHWLIRSGEISPDVTLNDEGKVTLAIKSLAFIKRNQANKALLYRELEHANFWYGGGENQNSPVSQQDAALRLWMTQLLFDNTWEHWIANHLIPEQSGSDLTVRRWRELMYHRLLDRVEYDTSPRRGEVNQIWQFIVLEHFPLLQLHDEAINVLRIDSYDWHDLYAGTLFLHYASGNYDIHKDINFAQDIGNLLYILSRVTGQYGYFFRLPALVQTAVNTPRTQGEPAKKRPLALNDYFAARNAHLEAHDLVTAFQDAMGQWRTQRQLAKELIEKHYPNFSPDEQAEHLQRYLFPYAALTLPRPPAAPPAPHSVLQDLPHLDEAYRQRTEKVGKSYLAQDRWLCATGWNALADDEHVFLRQATIQLIQLGHLMPSQPHPEGSKSEHVYQQKENVDIFMATSANEERLYIAVNAYDGYSVKRVNKLEDHLGELVAGPSLLQVGIRVSPVMQMKSEQQTLAAFFDAIEHRHQQIFTSRLGEYGIGGAQRDVVPDIGSENGVYRWLQG